MSMKAHRDWGRENKGIEKPNIVCPITAHPAFDKAASYFKIRIIHVKVGFDKSASYFKIRIIHVKVGFDKSASYFKIYELYM